MATVSSGRSSPSSSASTELQRIEREVRRIQQQLAQKRSGKLVQEFQKGTRDVKFENHATARDIGQLKKNETRLNLFSVLSVGDSVDSFRFQVATKTATTFSILNANSEDDGKLRFQLFSRATGRIIADSDADAGVARAVFEALQDGVFEPDEGEYILRISRAHELRADRRREFRYAIQLSQGLYTKDYDTIERPSRTSDDPYGLSNGSEAVATLTSSIASSVSFIQRLPRIGAPATDKLLGALVNGFV